MGELYLVISIWFDNMHEKAAFQPLLSQLNGKHIRDSNQDNNKNEINIDSQKSYENYQANEKSKGNNGIGKDKNEGDKNGGDKNKDERKKSAIIANTIRMKYLPQLVLFLPILICQKNLCYCFYSSLYLH